MNNKIESKAMSIGIVLNFIMAFAGIYMYWTTNIDAIFLDGTFSLMEAISCVVAVIITKYSAREHKVFPDGLYVLEPLYSFIKCFVCFGLIAFSSYEATMKLYLYLKYGIGVPLQLDAVVAYTSFMVTLCMILSYIFYWYNKKTSMTSTILTAETKTAFVDGMLSLGIGLTALLLMFIPEKSMFGFMYYIGDSAMTIALVMVVIREPVIILKECFIELTHGVIQKKSVVNPVIVTVETEIKEFPILTLKNINIHKTGKLIGVNITVEPSFEGAIFYKEARLFCTKVETLLKKQLPLVKVRVEI